MGKRYKNLFESIADIDNLRLAYEKTVRGGNRYTKGHLRFKEYLEVNLYLLQKALINGTYRHGTYHCFNVYEPKCREIKALPFKDRVVQHAINNILEPIFEKLFYSSSYACRKNKGTHKGVKHVQATLRKLSLNGPVYYLKMDFRKYFHSIDKQVLMREIQRKISDKKVLNLLKIFHDNSSKGIPIGNLLSQLFANVYGHIFDRFVKTRIKAKHYFRYMDDTVILSNSKQQLVIYQRKLSLFSYLYMKLKFSKWFINPISKPLNFLGYRISPKYKLIRKDSVIRAKRKIKKYRALNDKKRLERFLASWLGHAKSADSFNLIKSLHI
ncbi:Retron-type reverse transcriptase [Arcobacter sp. CECT 8989]|uniref:reverse transcriptase/maturase family protein n=1 Tax=Arcobacter sp. CECT 8989 TaxID=2044509 RepID=UPI00100AC21A|nr:reverse transcriptase/maturase family protein [Arcobacter sp. CECT 8989]RXK03817.1 Retron-type reverse transcriptase [Arcobacter sp. CECT 8989]